MYKFNIIILSVTKWQEETTYNQTQNINNETDNQKRP
jgi:hypothetical protein